MNSVKVIRHIPDPVLRTVSKPVESIDDKIYNLLEDLSITMEMRDGLGLAAVQIGKPLRVFVAKSPTNQEPIFFINPNIISFSDEHSVYEEGCLSIPNYTAKVSRPASCTIEYTDKNKNNQVIEAEGILARVIQHEFDHLNGILFIDHLSRLKRDIITRKFTKKANHLFCY